MVSFRETPSLGLAGPVMAVAYITFAAALESTLKVKIRGSQSGNSNNK